MRAPIEVVERHRALPRPVDEDERVTGLAVMGLPFESGHYLALRDWASVSFADPYRAVFHKSPDGYWTIYTDAAPQNGCGRFWSSAVDEIVETEIDITWHDAGSAVVRVPEAELIWTLECGRSFPTAVMSGAGDAMPERAWTNSLMLGMMGRMAGPFLRIGKVRLEGHLPNGQHFTMAPKVLWEIASSAASIRGQDLGSPEKIQDQLSLGEVWLPTRGLVAVGYVRAEAYDGRRHRSATETRSA